jgi:hypothetical protein
MRGPKVDLNVRNGSKADIRAAAKFSLTRLRRNAAD